MFTLTGKNVTIFVVSFDHCHTFIKLREETYNGKKVKEHGRQQRCGVCVVCVHGGCGYLPHNSFEPHG